MKGYLLLARMMLKNTITGLNPFDRFRSDKKSKAAVKSMLLGLVLLFALGSVVYAEYELFGVLRSMGQEALLPAMTMLMAMMASLLLGLFQSISGLYQGRDAAWLAVLPVSSRQIYAAKLTSLYLSDLVLNLPIIIPAAVLYLTSRTDLILPILRLIPIFLFLPVLPLAIVSLVSYLLMKLSSFARNRETVLTGLSILFMVGYMLTVSRISAVSGADGEEAVARMLASEDGLMNKLLSGFPPARWAAQGFIGSFWLMLLFCLVSAVGMAVSFLLTGRDYLPTALSAGEKTHKGGKGRAAVSASRAASPLAALIRLEIRDLVRTQTYLLNGVLGGLVMPIALMIGVSSGMSQVGNVGKNEMSEVFGQLDLSLLIIIATGAFYLCSFINQLPATAVSREGRHYPLSLSLPVRQSVRLTAKLLVSLVLNLLSMLILLVPVLFFLPLPLHGLLAAFGLAFLLSVFPAAFCLYMDARRPKLNWMTEIDALKKNFNSYFSLIFWIVGAAVCVITVLLLFRNGDFTPSLIGLTVCAIVLSGGSLAWLYHQAGRLEFLPENAD